MAFPRAKVKRFNEITSCAPPPGSYDPKSLDKVPVPSLDSKDERFKEPKESAGTSTPGKLDRTRSSSVSSVRSHRSATNSPSRPSMSSAPSMDSLAPCTTDDSTKIPRKSEGMAPPAFLPAEFAKMKELERQLRMVVQERNAIHKNLLQKTEELQKAEGKMVVLMKEKTEAESLGARLEREVSDLTRSNHLLKQKVDTSPLDRRIRYMEDVLAAREKESLSLKESLASSNLELCRFKEKSEENASALKQAQEQLNDTVKEHSDIIKGLNDLLGSREQKIGDLENLLEINILEIEELKALLREKEKTHSKSEEEFKLLLKSNHYLEAMLSEKKSEIDKLMKRLEHIEEENLDWIISSKDSEIAELQRLEAEYRNKLDAMDKSTEMFCNDLRKEKDKLKEEFDEKVNLVLELEAVVNEKDSQISNLESAMEKKVSEIRDFRLKIGERDAEIAELERINLESKGALEEARSLADLCSQLRAEIYEAGVKRMDDIFSKDQKLAELSDRLLDRESTIEALRAANDQSEKLKVDLEGANEKSDKLMAELEETIEKSEKLEAELEAAHNNLEKLKMEVETTNETVEKLQLELEKNSEESSKLVAEVEDNLKETEKRRVELEIAVIVKDQELTGLSNQLMEMESTVSSLEADFHGANELKENLKLELEKRNEEIERLKAEIEGANEEAEKHKAELEGIVNAKEDELNCLHDDLAKLKEKVSDLELNLVKENKMNSEIRELLRMREVALIKLQVLCQESKSLSMELEKRLEVEADAVRKLEGILIEKEEIVSNLEKRLSDEIAKRREAEEVDSSKADLVQDLITSSKNLKLELEEQIARKEDECRVLASDLEVQFQVALDLEEKLKDAEEKKSLVEVELEKKLSISNEEVAKMDENIKYLMDKLQCSEKMNSALETDFESLVVLNRDLKETLSEKQSQIESLEKDSIDSKIVRLDLEDKIRTEEDTIKELKELLALEVQKNGHLMFDLEEREERIKKQEQETESLKMDLLRVTEDVESRTHLLIHSRESADDLSQQLNYKVEELREMKKKLEVSESLKKSFEAECSATLVELDSYKEELSRIKSEQEVALENSKRMELEHKAVLAELHEEIEELNSKKISLLTERSQLEMEYDQMSFKLQETTSVFQRKLGEQAALLHDENDARIRKYEDKLSRVKAECGEWKSKFEVLSNKIAPFKDQIEQYEVERQCLESKNKSAKMEVDKLSQEYAKLIGHQNHKQKIHHLVKLKEENMSLKEELDKLRSKEAMNRRRIERLTEKLDGLEGKRRFDPEMAFKSAKAPTDEPTQRRQTTFGDEVFGQMPLKIGKENERMTMASGLLSSRSYHPKEVGGATGDDRKYTLASSSSSSSSSAAKQFLRDGNR